ncbi:carbohydrate sulfotransferase 3-like isoform X2 [Ptychodera flava]
MIRRRTKTLVFISVSVVVLNSLYFLWTHKLISFTKTFEERNVIVSPPTGVQADGIDGNDNHPLRKSTESPAHHNGKPMNDASNKGEKESRILLFADYRTGSTFVGQLLNQNKDVFYFFEPLRPVSDMIKRNTISLDHSNSTKLEILKDLYNCRFPTYYLYHIQHWGLAPSGSKALRALCRAHGGCNNVTVNHLVDHCKGYRHIGMKVIRLESLDQLESLVTEDKLDLKILHLIRDPRGVASSRKFISQKFLISRKNKTISKVGLTPRMQYYCKRSSETILYSKRLPFWLKDRYKIIRYEDIAMDPFGLVQEMYNYSGLVSSEDVSKWITVNTQSKKNGVSNMSTRKNSSEVVQSWRNKLLFEDVTIIQSFCAELMSLMNYTMLMTENQMKDMNYKTF